MGLVPFYPNANLRHYTFLVHGLPELPRRLGKRGVGLVLRRYPDHQLVKSCEEVRPCLVVGDENPMREPTKPMLTEAAAAGFYEPPEPEEKFIKVRRAPSARSPSIQILTIAELLAGKKLAYPSGPAARDQIFANAERKTKTQQEGLF